MSLSVTALTFSADRGLNRCPGHLLSEWRCHCNPTWEPCTRDWEYVLNPRQEPHLWTMKEILNSHELAEEGRHMRHCVYSYLVSCRRRRSAIFSLRCDGERRVTVEVSLPHFTIRQACGHMNRRLDNDENARLSRRFRETSTPSAELSPESSPYARMTGTA